MACGENVSGGVMKKGQLNLPSQWCQIGDNVSLWSNVKIEQNTLILVLQKIKSAHGDQSVISYS